MQRTSDTAIVLKDGRTLGYAEYGDPKGTPIILFHGTPGSRLCGVIFDRIAQEHKAHILVADRPGHVTSSPVRHGSLLSFVDDVVALADAFHFDTFAVLGASGGGPFALACTAKIPERVTCCGLMSAIGPLSLPHSMDGMASVNRTFFRLARFLPALPGLLIPRQIKSSMKSMQKYIDEGTSPLADVPPVIFAPMKADQLEAVRTGGKGISFDFGILTREWGFQLEKIHSIRTNGQVMHLPLFFTAERAAQSTPHLRFFRSCAHCSYTFVSNIDTFGPGNETLDLVLLFVAKGTNVRLPPTFSHHCVRFSCL